MHTLFLVAAVLFIIAFSVGVTALLIGFLSQRAHIAKLEHSLQVAVTALGREFMIPEAQIAELAGAISQKISFTGVKN